MFSLREFATPSLVHSLATDLDHDEYLSALRDELPTYSRHGSSRHHVNTTVERQSHEFSLQSTNKRPWATLHLRSWARSAKSLPVFFEDQKVTGQVDLCLQRPENIKSVVVSINGLVCAGRDERLFLDLSETLWDSSQGDPRSPGPQNRTKYTEKLNGRYSWPFSISLPPEISVGQKIVKELGLKPIERLPPSLSGMGWHPTINYRVILDIKRHGALRPDSSLSTFIGYTPSVRPNAPSISRQQSYRAKTPILGPSLDPCGWHVMQDLEVAGTLFRQREVTVTYTMALATPLAYTRGSVIPFHLTVRSEDRQALDLLSSPQAPQVIVRRKLATRVALAQKEKYDLSTLEEGDSPLAKAIWASALPGGAQPEDRDGFTRSLMGEVSVPLGCTPSFVFGGFTLEYFVDIRPPSPTGFQPYRERILASIPVSIMSAHAEGCPRPRAYITPAHDVSRRVVQADALADQLSAMALDGRAE